MRRFLIGALALTILFAGVSLALEHSADAARKKIIYFTAGHAPTAGEKTDITNLNAAAAAQYDVIVVNGKKLKTRVVAAPDYVAGTIPPVYRDGGTDSSPLIFPVFDPSSPPAAPNLPSAQTMIKSGVAVPIPGGGSLTLTISNNVVTAVAAYRPKDGGT